MSIKVIGAGFPRTGTTTIKKALEILGYDKTYHFKDLIGNPDDLQYWKQLENEGRTNYAKLFEGYTATSDFPGYSYYKILMAEFPDAKVILSTRDVEAWYNSTFKTIWQAGPQTVPAKIIMLFKLLFNSRLRKKIKCIKFMRKVYLAKQFNSKFNDKAYAQKTFQNHLDEVINYVPKEKLLVFDVGQGWEPLCTFLGKPVPSESFPHLNKKEHFHAMVKGMINEKS